VSVIFIFIFIYFLIRDLRLRFGMISYIIVIAVKNCDKYVMAVIVTVT